MSFFLGSKKRDLSGKSWNGEDSKKHRDNSDSGSSLPHDAFSDGFNSPECAKILINCLKSIQLHIKELFVFHNDAKDSQIKEEKLLESLEDALELLSENLMIYRKMARRKIKTFVELKKSWILRVKIGE